MKFDDDPCDPKDPRNRDRTRAARREIRRLLVAWDPIGVADTESDDEYDFMISPLMHMLFAGTNEQELLARLAADRDYMGLGEDTLGTDRRLAAELLKRWAGRHRAE